MYFIALFFGLSVLLSCSGLTQQYILPSQSQTNRMLQDITLPENQPSQPLGGYRLQEPKKLTEAEKDERTRKNSLAPILYKSRSAGNINMKTEQETALDILNLHYARGPQHYYKEGLVVIWRTDPPLIPRLIFVLSGYQGTMDFGPAITEGPSKRRVGQSFADQFSFGDVKIEQDPKAIRFITSLYKYLEDKKEENCLQSQKCQLLINPEGDYIVFGLPKMVLLFGNNERRLLTQIAIKANDEPGCFKNPFDLIMAQFLCEKDSDGSHWTLKLGTEYKTVVQKSGISQDLPLNYTNNFLVQATESTLIGWKRIDLEKKSETVLEKSPLLYVGMSSNYNQPFVLAHSLIKIQKNSSSTVQMHLDPITENTKRNVTVEDIQKKLAKGAGPEAFYLSTSMPQIKGNYKLQKNMTKSLLDMLEKEYLSFYNARGVKVKVYKKIYGEYNDKYVPESTGVLTLSFPTSSMESYSFLPTLPRLPGLRTPLDLNLPTTTGNPYISVYFSIDHPSGNMFLNMSIGENEFGKYILKNQKAISLNPSEPLILNGFSLGDKLYLRNQNIGEGTAITAYLVDSQPLIALANYTYESEMPVIYESGRDKKITFQKGVSLSISGMEFHINPTAQKKEIQGQVFDEYEINGMFTGAGVFFESVQNLCFINDFQINMGLFDRYFEQELNQKIMQIRSEQNPMQAQEDFICPYIAPQDPLSSGVKRSYFFPDHYMKLLFSDRELSSIGFYKKPSNQTGQ